MSRRHRPDRPLLIVRAMAVALAGLIAMAGTVSADGVQADGDALTPAVDGTVHLGDIEPGGEVAIDVRFVLTCSGLGHVDPGQSVVLTRSGGIQPADGAIVSVATVTLDPAPAGWTADGEGCPTPAPTNEGGATSAVVLRAPTTPGDGYVYTVTWDRSLDPVGSGDASAFGRTPTTVSFTLDVVADVPPTLHLPDDPTVEGDTPGGWTADWTGVRATDPEDEPDPSATCVPGPGAVLPLGTTTVDCAVTDAAGTTIHGTFQVTVVDTTPPTLVGLPADQDLTTTDPAGTTLTYALPGAEDLVDPAPAVECLPAPGSAIAPGTTTVTCTATDALGNAAAGSFDVTVTHVPVTSVTAAWLEPVGEAGLVVGQRGRALPVKVRLWVDGTERLDGDASLALVPCGGGDPVVVALTIQGGRWQAAIDTGPLPHTCWSVTAHLDGAAAGSFRLELRGTEAAPGTDGRTLGAAPGELP